MCPVVTVLGTENIFSVHLIPGFDFSICSPWFSLSLAVPIRAVCLQAMIFVLGKLKEEGNLLGEIEERSNFWKGWRPSVGKGSASGPLGYHSGISWLSQRE